MIPPRGLRNKNPGNIRRSAIPWRGKVAGADPEFETFDTAFNGIRALCRILLTYYRQHGLKSCEQIVARWAPAAENDTAAYAAHVARLLGVATDEPLAVDDSDTLARLAEAIIRHENGEQPYAADLIHRAALSALI